MTDEIKMLISDIIKILATAIGTLIVSRWKPKGEKRDTTIDRQVKLIDIQGETLADAFTQIRDLRAEITAIDEKLQQSNEKVLFLQNATRRYANGLARAIRFINKNMPGATIPDFLTDTGDH